MALNKNTLDLSQPLSFIGGVNLNKDSKTIRDDQSVYSKNLFPSFSGILQKRPGLAFDRVAGANLQLVPYSLALTSNKGQVPFIGHALDISRAPTYTEYLFAGGLQQKSIGADFVSSHITQAIGTGAQIEPMCYTLYGSSVIITKKGGFVINSVPWDFMRLVVDPMAGTGKFVPGSFASSANGQTQAIPVRPAVSCVFKGRMCYFNFGLGMENWGVFADASSSVWTASDASPISTIVGADVLAYNSRHVEFQGVAGESIVAAFEAQLMATGSPVDTVLVILTEKSMLLCTGEFTQTTDTGSGDPSELLGSLVANKVNYTVGCASPNTVVKTPYGYVWASSSDVWMLAGNAPIKIGTNITQALQNTPPDARKFWSAAYCKDPGVYVLDMIQSRGLDDSLLQHNQWWLTLNDAVMPQNADQARWFGPMVVERDNGDGTTYHGGICLDYDESRILKLVTDNGYLNGTFFSTSCVVLTDPGQSDDVSWNIPPNGEVWTAGNLQQLGDIIRPTTRKNNGRIYVADLVSGDQTTGVTEPVWPDTNGGNVVDNNVTWVEVQGISEVLYRMLNYDSQTKDIVNHGEWRSKQYSYGLPELAKIFKRAEISAYSSLPAPLTAHIITNGGVNSQVGGTPSIGQGLATAAGNGPDGGFIAEGQFEGRSLRPAEGAIIRGQYLQLLLRDGMLSSGSIVGGYVIDNTCNSLCFVVLNFADVSGLALAQVYQATIVLGASGVNVYSSIETLMAAVVAAMNTATPAGSLGNCITVAANPWSHTNVTGLYPYFQNLKLAVTARLNTSSIVGLLFGNSNGISYATNQAFVNPVGTFDLLKSRKLLSLLGFDTEQLGAAQLSVYNSALPHFEYLSPENIPAIIGTGGMTASIWAKTQVAYQRSARMQLDSGNILGRFTTTAPLQNSSR